MNVSVSKSRVIGLFTRQTAASGDSTFLEGFLERREEYLNNPAPNRYRRAERTGTRVLAAQAQDGVAVYATAVTPAKLLSDFPFVEAEDLTRM